MWSKYEIYKDNLMKFLFYVQWFLKYDILIKLFAFFKKHMVDFSFVCYNYDCVIIKNTQVEAIKPNVNKKMYSFEIEKQFITKSYLK